MLFRSSVLSLILLLAAPVILADEEESLDATILCYHVVESPNDTRFSISREAFREQLRYLASTGYNVIPLAHLHEYITGKRETLPKNAVVITVDDGWRCTYTEIYPELKRFGFPFTVFIYPKFIGMGAYAMTWKQVREMADDGVDFQSHTLSHAFLSYKRNRDKGEAGYKEWLEDELVKSKKKIEEKTGRDVRFLAYPYGDFDSRSSAGAAEAGYEGALTCEFGAVRKGSDPLRMKRVVIDAKTTLETFRRYLGNAPMAVTEQTPQPENSFDSQLPVISARIVDHERLDPATVGMALLSLGRTPYSYDPRDGSISLVVREPLDENRHRVLVWGIDKKTGERVEASWSFRLDKPTSPNTAAEVIATSSTKAQPATPDTKEPKATGGGADRAERTSEDSRDLRSQRRMKR